MVILLSILGVFVAFIALALAAVAFIGRRYHRIQGASRAVAAWSPALEPTRRIGKLHTRTHGNLDGRTAVVALHGLASSGAYFGENWAALTDENTSLIVPDLLGFGDSVDRSRSAEEHSIGHHVAAVDETVGLAAPDAEQIHIVAHSFGSIVALAYARQVIDRVASVTLISPPLHNSREEAESYIVARGRVVALFAVDRLAARIMRALLCSRPVFARTVTRFAAPAMPDELARRTHLHSWASYIGTFRALLDDMDNRSWKATMDTLAERGIPVRVLVGSRDFTVDRSIIDSLPKPNVTIVEDHGHQVPLTNPAWCVETVRTSIERFRANAQVTIANAQSSFEEAGERIASSMNGEFDGDTATV